MPNFNTTCPHCNAEVSLPVEGSCGEAECPNCRKHFGFLRPTAAKRIEPQSVNAASVDLPSEPPEEASAAPGAPALHVDSGSSVAVVPSNRKHIVYILLGIMWGAWGAHDFYAGYMDRGVTKVLISVFGGLLCGLGILATVIWSFIDIGTVKEDVDGRPFAD